MTNQQTDGHKEVTLLMKLSKKNTFDTISPDQVNHFLGKVQKTFSKCEHSNTRKCTISFPFSTASSRIFFSTLVT